MKKVKVSVTIASDEKDFSAVLDIITTHRSRALMSVNVESLLTYSSDHFLAILAKYSSHLKLYLNFFQSTVGKSSTGDVQRRGLSVNAVKVAAGNVSDVSDIFQTESGKRFHRHNHLPRREPHCGRVRHVARNESGYGGAVQATAHSQGCASADFRGVS